MSRRNRKPTEQDLQNARDMATLELICLETLGRGSFDSVQIIATRCDVNGTAAVSVGKGNCYARIESVRDWVKHNQ